MPNSVTDQAEAQLERVYRLLLGRGLDDEARSDKAARLAAGATSIVDLIAEIVASAEYRALVADDAGQERFTRDHSQFGELWLLIRELVNEAASSRWVVDIGARGRDRSNSYDLLREFGWRGLLVEANPALLDQIAQEFAGLDVRIVGAAVSDFTGRATLTIGANDDVSSLSRDAAQGWGDTRGSVKVDVVRLPELLKAHDVPHRFALLSIDIEGEDVKVLNDLLARSAYRPDWIIIEASYDFKTTALADVGASSIVQANYGIAAQTTANLLLRFAGREIAVRRYEPTDTYTDTDDASPTMPWDVPQATEATQGITAGARLRSLGRLLTPRAAKGVRKARYGGSGDGGYVMLDDIGGIRAAFSLGIGDNVSWDKQIAAHGIKIYQFDPTVAGSPEQDENFKFFRLRVTADAGDGEVTLSQLHQTAGLTAPTNDMRPCDILKIDIEHHEWAVIAATERRYLAPYRQIICELHAFNLVSDPNWSSVALSVLQKLDQDFQCVHVHGNNYAPFSIIGGTPFPAVLEVTLANRAYYEFVDEDCLYPTELDEPNNPAAADLYLGRFEF